MQPCMQPPAPPLLNRAAMAPLLLRSSTESNRTSQVTITPVSARTGDLHVVGHCCSDSMSQPRRLISPSSQQHETIPPPSSSHRSVVQATSQRRSSAIFPFLVVSTSRQPPYVAISPGHRRHLHNPSSITLKP
ncbi:hypothetical protein SESBI_49600 [Sesbania bispinosa]|nr:hypothetical protein SESBI_49600 [Sesbania bispinosa]